MWQNVLFRLSYNPGANQEYTVPEWSSGVLIRKHKTRSCTYRPI